MIDKEKLLNDADCIVVASSLGLKMQRRGRRQTILCPEHADRHFGNCIIDHDHYHCFACQATGNAIELVMNTLCCSYSEALSYVAEVCGGEEMYTIRSDDSDVEKPRPYLSADARKYLGLQDSPVYAIVGETGNFKESLQYQEEGYKVEYIEEYKPGAKPKDPPIFNSYVISKIVCRSPLAELYYDDENSYFNLVRQRCEEKAEDINEFYDVLLNDQESTIGTPAAKMYLQEMGKLSDIFHRFCTGKEPVGFFRLKQKAKAILDSMAWWSGVGQYEENAVGF